jgi:hypothetical protein
VSLGFLPGHRQLIIRNQVREHDEHEDSPEDMKWRKLPEERIVHKVIQPLTMTDIEDKDGQEN